MLYIGLIFLLLPTAVLPCWPWTRQSRVAPVSHMTPVVPARVAWEGSSDLPVRTERADLSVVPPTLETESKIAEPDHGIYEDGDLMFDMAGAHGGQTQSERATGRSEEVASIGEVAVELGDK